MKLYGKKKVKTGHMECPIKSKYFGGHQAVHYSIKL